jgi:hypothetical protein
MSPIEAYIRMFNEVSYPIRFPYFLKKWGPYRTPDDKFSIGVELQLFIDHNKFKTLFIVSENYPTENHREKAEQKVLEAFRMIDFNQYLKYLWRES